MGLFADRNLLRDISQHGDRQRLVRGGSDRELTVAAGRRALIRTLYEYDDSGHRLSAFVAHLSRDLPRKGGGLCP